LNPRPPPCQGVQIEANTLSEYLDIIKLKGITNKHISEVTRYLTKYLQYTRYKIDKQKFLQYFTYLKNNYSISTYRKEGCQILKFLRFLKIDWINEIKLPAEPIYYPKQISNDDIRITLKHFENSEYYFRFKAIILLGSTSGLRAEELYQLTIQDIDNRIVYVNHNPINGQTTKTKQGRVSFFNKETQQTLLDYFNYFNSNSSLIKLFPQRWLEKHFKNKPIRVKDLRKFFSQEWDRKGGATSIKKILMGHSLKGDVDLMHYNCQSEEDLKKIYDKVMMD